MIAANTTPSWLPKPPKTTIARITADSMKVKLSGLMKPWRVAKNEPAKPANIAPMPNAVTLRLRRLPIGRAWEALREDEIACRALGINPTTVKLSAFAIGALLGGFAGAFFATRQGFISPESFTFQESATILAIVVLGGMGRQMGVVLAAIVLVTLPEFGRVFAEFRMLLFGASMVAIMVWRPRGLLAERAPSIRLAGAA